jgi:hypothetical protein
MNQSQLNTITGVLLLASTLEPVALQLTQSLLTQVGGLTVTQIQALADAQYSKLGEAAQTELDKLK